MIIQSHFNYYQMINKFFRGKILLLAFGALSSITLNSQTSLTLQANALYLKPHGGFEYTAPFKSETGRITLGISVRDSSLIGFSAHIAAGRKSLTYSYPLFMLCQDLNGPYVCVQPTLAPQGFVFRYIETYVGATIFGGRIFQFSLGPYLSYNSAKSESYSFDVDPNYFYPYLLKDLYKRIEFGAQAQLGINIPIKEHFFLQANGLIGASLNDLRKNKWDTAKSFLGNGNGEYVKMESEKVTNRFYSFGLGVGYKW